MKTFRGMVTFYLTIQKDARAYALLVVLAFALVGTFDGFDLMHACEERASCSSDGVDEFTDLHQWRL
ncbi:MAG: hypothetical protein ACFFB3_18070 [Candidatus Hodarchaeota archaeon]